MFDTEKFICEIRKRPALYDVKCKEYCYRDLKAKCWLEIGEVMFADWNRLSEAEANRKGKELAKKWKGLRDCFVKDYKRQSTRSGKHASKKRYIYFDHMQFLTPIINVGRETTTDSSSVVKDEPADESDTESGPRFNTNEAAERERSCKKRNIHAARCDGVQSNDLGDDSECGSEVNADKRTEGSGLCKRRNMGGTGSEGVQADEPADDGGTKSGPQIKAGEKVGKGGLCQRRHIKDTRSHKLQTVEPGKDGDTESDSQINASPTAESEGLCQKKLVCGTRRDNMEAIEGDFQLNANKTNSQTSAPRRRRINRLSDIRRTHNGNILLRAAKYFTDILSKSIYLQRADKANDRHGNRAFLTSFLPVMDSLPIHLQLEARLRMAGLFKELSSANVPPTR